MPRPPTWDIDPVELHRLYCIEKFSTTEIARQYNLYQPNGAVDSPKVQRALERLNIPIRNKSDAQRLSLEQGFSKPPVQGRARTIEERMKTGATLVESYKKSSDEEKKKRTRGVREFWTNKDNWKKQTETRRKIGDQLQKTIQEGTFLEKSIAKFLIQQGYSVDMHAKGILEDPSLECDMLVKGKGVVVCVELDGNRHWGKFMNRTAADLAHTIQVDMRKNGLVLSHRGVFMLRILYDFGNDLTYVRATLEKVHEVFEYIREMSNTQLSSKDRLIVLDMGLVLQNKSLRENNMWKAALKILKNK